MFKMLYYAMVIQNLKFGIDNTKKRFLRYSHDRMIRLYSWEYLQITVKDDFEEKQNWNNIILSRHCTSKNK